VKNNLTGANYGIGSWLQQKITAVIMLIISIAFIGILLYLKLQLKADIGIHSWQSIFHCVFIQIIIQIFIIALLLHAWIGLRDIWMDYMQSNIIRLMFHSATILWLLVNFIYSIKVIWL
jgi:succinate dehydrogenase / fumarate reductase membrane anchor subunit